MKSNWVIKYQSIVKPENDIFANGLSRSNEDAVLAEKYLVGIADGAGGVGLYASSWANKILSKIPKKRITNYSSFISWISSFWEEFYIDNLKKAERDSFLLQKFENEGSFATLCVAWLSKKENKLNYLVYGDTIIFKYNKITNALTVPNSFKNYNNFNRNPFLINWKDENILEEGLETGEWGVESNEVVLIASDALGQFIYAYYLAGIEEGKLTLENEISNQTKLASYITSIIKMPLGPFNKVLDELIISTYSEDKFRTLLHSWWVNKLIHRDDYSLIVVSK
jgi:hypothetical protein